MLDSTFGYVSPTIASFIGKPNGNLSVNRIGWLSQPGKKYKLHDFSLEKKFQADVMKARGFLKVGEEIDITQALKMEGK